MSQPEKPHRPLTAATFHILLSLMQQPAHGYHIKRMVEERTNARRSTRREGLIERSTRQDAGEAEPGTRWRFYAITELGREVLEAEIARIEADLAAARAIVHRPA